ncbi:MAG: 2-amino-4-hydroxy-6-hydroxymethyldihydropteridine diphosphokinase [Microbacteriaceae bacterium]
MMPAGTRPLRVVLGVGSNLGDRETTIRSALRALSAVDGVVVVAASGLVESQALTDAGYQEGAPRYLNAVVLADISMDPEQLLDALHRIEHDHGRVRTAHWGDRTLDLDIISVGDLMRQTARLTLPHPRAAERAFVLMPWLEVDPDAVIPGAGTVADLLDDAVGAVSPYPAAPLLEAVHQ